jgi:ligand-binding sensor domain-containing protein/serine phosphatase RsbU (regulator of sigma subunit)
LLFLLFLDRMKKRQFLIWVLVLLASCNESIQSTDLDEDTKNSSPLIPLNVNGGYSVNQFNNEEIKPIINAFGDTIKTGISIPVKGIEVNPDSVEMPRSVKFLSTSEKIIAQKNVYALNTDTFLIELGALTSQNLPTKPIKNTSGKVIQSGIPITVIPKLIPAKETESVQALSPRLRDNATINLHHFDVDHGLNSSYIHSILEDSKGNIWIGTAVGSLSKYNGANITHYSDNEGFKNCLIFDLVEDKNGNIWIATDQKGVVKYDGKNFYQYSELEGFSYNEVWDISEDSKGNLWFCTDGGGLIKFDGKQMTTYTVNEGLSGNRILRCFEDRHGIIWVGNKGKGIDVFDGQNFKQFIEEPKSTELENEIIESFLEDKEGNLWFGTETRGVFKLIDQALPSGKKQLVRYYSDSSYTLSNVRSIKEDKFGNIWFGSHGGGLSKFIEPTTTNKIAQAINYNDSQGLSNSYVLALLIDRMNNIWIATDGGGICILKEDYVNHYLSEDGVQSSYIISMIKRKNNEIWFGTFDNGIAIYDGQFFRQMNSQNGMFSNGIYAINEDQSGNIWMSNFGLGISVFDGESITLFTEKNGLKEVNYRDIVEDKNGNIWFVGNNTLTKYTPATQKGELGILTNFTDLGGFKVSDIWMMEEDQQGDFWLATTQGGIVKFNGESVFYYSEKEGLNSNKIFSLAIDSQNNLWSGAYGAGVCKFDGKSFEYFTEEDGLSSNIVTSLAISKDNRIVVGTESGLNVIDPTKKSAIGSAKNIIALNKNDGLKSLDFYQNSSLIDENNIAWLGSGKNLVSFDLNKFKREQTYPAAMLNGIKINDEFIDFRNLSPEDLKEIEFDSLVDFENYPKQLTVPYTKNHLTFEFVAIDWQTPHKVSYQYRIDGLDNNWSSITKKTSADYRNIPNGTYIFEVRAKTTGDEWGKTFQYHFTILPPWYRTWWFQTLVGIVLILSLILIYRWRTASLRKRQKVLENTVDLRTREVIAEKKLVEDQKLLIETKHKEITDSINYAERIQRSFLASHELLNQKLTDYFVYYQPKDVVSGDFYWASELKNRDFAIAIADSTGHGVPGAIMSILNISSLEKAIETEVSPEAILNETRKIIVKRLEKDGSLEGGKDGMDCSLLLLNEQKTTLKIAGANSIVYILRNGELIELIGDKMPVGKHDKDHIDFSLKTFDLQKNDQIYALTDGFADQFGGENGKKYMVKNLRNLLIKLSQYPIGEQKQHFMQAFETWRGKYEQLDDVCVVGFRV